MYFSKLFIKVAACSEKVSALQATVEVDKSKLILILKKYKKIIIIL